MWIGIDDFSRHGHHHHRLLRRSSYTVKESIDFWGRRWNKLTGPALRRGVHEPLRKCWNMNTHLAACLTFVGSGLLHEYVLYVLSQRRGEPNLPFTMSQRHMADNTYVPNYGNHFVFFAWCAMTLLGERLLGQYIGKVVPSSGPLRTVLVLSTTLPLAHLFTDEYVACSFYGDLSMGFPKLILEAEGSRTSL